MVLFAPFLFPSLLFGPDLVSLVIVSHRAARYFIAARAQRLQCSLTAAPTKVGISLSYPMKFIHLSASVVPASWTVLSANFRAKQTIVLELLCIFCFNFIIFFWITSSSCLD